MKILQVADIHYALKQYDWLLRAATQVDVLVIAGDLLDLSSAVPKDAQVVVVHTYLEQLATITRVVACSGNHDLDTEGQGGEAIAAWMAELGDRVIADGQSLDLAGTLLTACAWWDGPASRDAIARQLEKDSLVRKGAWIWAYHAPPSDSPVSWGGRRYFGDVALSDWIGRYRPDIVLSGHVHQAPFVSGGAWVDMIEGAWVFNMGQQPGPAPAHILIDTDAAEAIWFSIAGAEHLNLADPRSRPEPLVAPPYWLKAWDPTGQAARFG